MRILNPNSIPYGVVAVVAIAIGAGLAFQHRTPKNMAAMPAATSSSSSADAVSTTNVTLNNFAFAPASITVKKGSTVTWTNNDTVSHTVTADASGNGLSSPLFGRDATYAYTFTTVGTFSYHCMPHPYMHGTVIVTE